VLRHPSLIPLSHHHQHGLALCVIVERGLAADRSPENTSRLATKIRDMFELELRNHFDLEERILFPAIRDTMGEHPLVEELLKDHRALEALVQGLTTPEDLLAFTQRLEPHIRREERELFEEIQKRLPPDTLEQLGQSLARDAVQVCLEP
jgi:hemerythrin-like domain-containing protein